MANIDSKVSDYLMKMYGNLEDKTTPDALQRQADLQRDTRDTTAFWQTVPTLAKSFAQIGNVRGKPSDTSPVSDFSNAMVTQNRQQGADRVARDDALDKNTGMRMKILQYIQDRKDAQAKQDAARQQWAMQFGQRQRQNDISNGMQSAGLRLRQTLQDSNAVKELANRIDPGAVVRTQFIGRNQQAIEGADKVMTFKDKFMRDHNLPPDASRQQVVQALHSATPQDVGEFIVASAALTQPGANGAPPITIYEHLLPKTAKGHVADWKQWLIGEPQGAEQGEFIMRALDVAEAEKHNSNEKIKSYQKQILDSRKDPMQNSSGFQGQEWQKLNDKYFQGAPATDFDAQGNYIQKPWKGNLPNQPPEIPSPTPGSTIRGIRA